MGKIIVMTNKDNVMNIYNSLDKAVDSIKEDSENPMKKLLIQTAIENGCKAYDKNWMQIKKIIFSKDFLVDFLKSLTDDEYNNLIEKVGRKEVIIKEEKVEEEPKEIKFEKVLEPITVKEPKIELPIVEDKKLNVFNPLFIPNNEKIVDCYTNYSNQHFDKSVKFNRFNLHKENEEILRVLVYSINDKKKSIFY